MKTQKNDLKDMTDSVVDAGDVNNMTMKPQ